MKNFTLNEGEKIILQTRAGYKVLIFPIILFSIVAIFPFIVNPLFGVAVFILFTAIIVLGFFHINKTKLILTNQRFYGATGTTATKIKNIPLRRISFSSHVHKPTKLLPYIFGYRQLTIEVYSSDIYRHGTTASTTYDNIKKASIFLQALVNAIGDVEEMQQTEQAKEMIDFELYKAKIQAAEIAKAMRNPSPEE